MYDSEILKVTVNFGEISAREIKEIIHETNVPAELDLNLDHILTFETPQDLFTFLDLLEKTCAVSNVFTYRVVKTFEGCRVEVD